MSNVQAMRAFGPGRFPATQGGASNADTQLDAVPTGAAGDPGGQLLHPNNPLLAFGAIALVTFGLMAFSTSIRVGKTRAGLTIGDTGK